MYNKHLYRVEVDHDLDDENNTCITNVVEIEAPNHSVAMELAELWLWRYRHHRQIDQELDMSFSTSFQPGETLFDGSESIRTNWE